MSSDAPQSAPGPTTSTKPTCRSDPQHAAGASAGHLIKTAGASSINNALSQPYLRVDSQPPTGLEAALETQVLPLFAGRVLPFDEAAARSFARLHSQALAAGHTLGLADAYIAAIAVSRGFAVATRDVAPFVAAGVEVIDPWGR